MELTTQRLWMNAKDYVFIVFGIALYGLGFAGFIAPEGVIMGGMAGLGQIVYYLTLKIFGWGIPVAVTMYAVNLILLAFAYRIVGLTFVIRTILGVTLASLFIGIFIPLFPEPLVKGQTFMNVIIGAILCGVGLGMALSHNGSTGGTDIVAAIVNKKSNISMGRTMLMIDFCIISSSLLVFGFHEGAEKLVYSVIVLYVLPTMADYIINSNRQSVQFLIISPYWKEIAEAVIRDGHRGCTVLNGMGWYSKEEHKVLLVVCRRVEALTISRIIKSIDPTAFVTQGNVTGVYGRGFDELKVRVKSPDAAGKSKQIEADSPDVPGTSPSA